MGNAHFFGVEKNWTNEKQKREIKSSVIQIQVWFDIKNQVFLFFLNSFGPSCFCFLKLTSYCAYINCGRIEWLCLGGSWTIKRWRIQMTCTNHKLILKKRNVRHWINNPLFKTHLNPILVRGRDWIEHAIVFFFPLIPPNIFVRSFFPPSSLPSNHFFHLVACCLHSFLPICVPSRPVNSLFHLRKQKQNAFDEK